MRNTILYISIILSSFALPALAVDYTWNGSNSAYFNDSLNWTPKWSNPLAPTSTENVLIAANTPNNPVFYKGSSTLLYKRFNTAKGANTTIRGTLWANANDSLNGTVLLDDNSEMNIRSYIYIGKNSTGYVTVKSTLTSKYTIYVGSNGAGTLLIDGGRVNSGASVIIGTSGKIIFKGVGEFQLTGNQVSTINTYISAGKIVCDDTSKTLDVTYDGTKTLVRIHRSFTTSLVEYPQSVVLSNGYITATIAKKTATITSLLYKGFNMVSTVDGAYWDWTGSAYETVNHALFSVVQNNDSVVDIAFTRSYDPLRGDDIAADMTIHYVIKPGVSGLYVYSELSHQPTYPFSNLNCWRMVFAKGGDDSNYYCEKVYVDSLRHWTMPSKTDSLVTSGIQEIEYVYTGPRAGHTEGKYMYSAELWNLKTYGFASDVNHIGTWMMHGSYEYYSCGPKYQDLNCTKGTISMYFQQQHYGANGLDLNLGDTWNKVYGPFLIYFNDKTNADESYVDAKQQADTEKAKWPYAWLTNNPNYPLKDARGSISGNFAISDPSKPQITGANAWIGVTQLSAMADGQWQQEGKNYHYWVKTDENGNFSISNIRPGTYSLYAFKDGEVGEYSRVNVVVTAGQNNDLGNLKWNIVRTNGVIAWEIGTPDRSSQEFDHGHTDYFEGFRYDTFYQQYANPIEYNVSDNNYDTKLPYAHCPLKSATGTMSAWTWNINFNLSSNISRTGYATLTIAYAGSDHARQHFVVNGDATVISDFYPTNSGGNALIRQANRAMYSYATFKIPMSKLNIGSNKIGLSEARIDAVGNHMMYDYLCLEVPVNPNAVDNPTSVDAYKIYDKNHGLMIETDSDNLNQTIAVFNTLGQKIAEQKNNNPSCFIPVSESGVYLVTITSNRSSYSQKVIIK